MKVRARKLLSLLLTLAMVAGMFVLPASATADMELDMATSAASALTDLSGDFTWSAGTGTGDSVATDKGYMFSDSYTGSKSVKWNGTSNANGSRRTLDFTTTAQATVKVWWYMAKAGAKLCIWTGSSTTATSGTDAAESNPSYAITTFENVPAGAVKLGFTAEKGQVFKIEVSYGSGDPDAPKNTITKGAATNGSFTVAVGSAEVTEAAEGATVTVTAAPSSGYKVTKVTYTPDGGTETVAFEKEVNVYTFKMPNKAVTVNVTFEEGHVATPQTYKLSTTITAMNTAGYADAEPLLVGPVYNSGYFSIAADTATDGLQYRNNKGTLYLEVGAAVHNNGIEFTVESTANVTVKVSSTGSNNWSVAALKKDGENQVIATSVPGSATVNLYADGDLSGAAATAGSDAKVAHIKTAKEATLTYTGLTAGTYRLYSPAVTNYDETNNPSGRGFRVYDIVVVEADAEKKPDVEDKEVTKVTVSPATASLAVGETANLTFEVLPVDALNRQVTWTSSDTNVATVEVVKGKVVVTAVAEGEAEITATSVKTASVSGKCTVTVTADKSLKSLSASPASVTLKTGATADVTITAEPTNTDDTLTVISSDESVATAALNGKKVTITANGTKAGNATITVSGTTATDVTVEIPVTVELKKMKDSGSAQQSGVYKPGFAGFTAKAKAVDADTGADIPGVTYTYSVNGRDGEYTTTVPSISKPGMVTYFYKATATGYEDFTSTVGRNMTVSKGEPELSITAVPNRVKTTVDADRYTIITVDCTNIEGANVNNIKVSGKNLTADQELLANRFVKQSDGVYKVNFPEPDVSEAEYVFTASFGGNDYYEAATDQTARVTVVNSSVVDRTYKLTYDAKTIRITYTSSGSTDDAVLLGAGVEAEAIVPEGKEFVKWVSADLNPTDENWDTQNPTKFAMPGHNVTLSVVFQDKGEEPTPVNRTALVGALRTAEAYAEIPVVDTDAANVNKGEKWVEKADKDAFIAAIAKAQAVSSNEKATQDEVYKAVEDLDKATDAFTAAWKDGAKATGSTEPTTNEYVFDPTTYTAAADKETLTAAEVTGDVFGITGTVMKRVSSSSGKVYAVDTDKPSNGGAVTIKIPAGATATVVAQVASNGGSNTSNFELQKDGVKVNNEESLDTVTGSTDAAVTVNYTGLAEGTYSLLTPAGAANANRGLRVVKITVSITTAGGDAPVVPDSEARKALKEAVAAAKAAVEAVKVSADGEDISTSEQWVTEAIKTAYENAIELAEAKANSSRFDDEALTAAKTMLENSTNVFEAAKRDGKKSSSSSGGSSSGNVPTTGGGTTVTNPDGSKTNTKTNKTNGTVTETTTWPNGDKKVVVTKKDGTVTETFTKKDGSKSETVTNPDGSSTSTVTDTKGIKTETAVSASGETSAKVTLPNRVDKAIVTIPVKDVTEGTVAVIVDAKGNETVIKTAVATENGLELLVSGNVSVKIKDNAKSFQDVADGYWAKDAVDFVSSREIFKGTTDVTFSPLDTVDRGMMATVLYRLADGKAEGENIFSDVAAGTWYTDAVVWANRSGVVNGYTDKTFGPADAVTREQMATMLFRYAKVMGMDVSAKGDLSKFSDANDVSSWAGEAMTWAVGVNLINGVADPVTGTILAPAKTASRAEVATIMQRMVKLMMQ